MGAWLSGAQKSGKFSQLIFKTVICRKNRNIISPRTVQVIIFRKNGVNIHWLSIAFRMAENRIIAGFQRQKLQHSFCSPHSEPAVRKRLR